MDRHNKYSYVNKRNCLSLVCSESLNVIEMDREQKKDKIQPRPDTDEIYLKVHKNFAFMKPLLTENFA